jgi:hypothetical protein
LHLDVSGCENIFKDPFLMKMANKTRGRFGGNLIANISDIYKENSYLSKEDTKFIFIQRIHLESGNEINCEF